MTPPDNVPTYCSAGVGRTGTYVVIDSMLDRIQHEQTLDIFTFQQDNAQAHQAT